MKTVILCGGRGTRIRGINDDLPKPMIPIGNYPILFHIMSHYASYGHSEFVLTLGYLGWKIKEFFLNLNASINDFTLDLKSGNVEIQKNNSNFNLDWKIIAAETGLDTQTSGRIRKIRKYVENDEYFMLTYGDGLSSVNLNELIKYHKKHGKIATVTGVRPSGRFGEIETNSENKVMSFNEKPQVTSGRINGGFFVLDAKRIWDYLPESDDVMFEQDPLRNLTRDGELIMFPHDGFWQPMDTYREYLFLNDIWKNRKTSNIELWKGKETKI